jgi:hypothetical protein
MPFFFEAADLVADPLAGDLALKNSDALLAGKLLDDRGNRMSPSHAATPF